MKSTYKQTLKKAAGQSKYGRFSTGGKSIEVCNSYGVDARPTALTEDNLRALAEEKLPPKGRRPDSPVNTYNGAWEYSVVPVSPPTPQEPYSSAPFTSPTPTPSTSSTSSGCESAGQVAAGDHRQQVGYKSIAIRKDNGSDTGSSSLLLNQDDVEASVNPSTGGKNVALMELHGLLNSAEHEPHRLPTSKIHLIPVEIQDYLNDNPELVLAYIKKALDEGNTLFDVPTATTVESPQSDSESDLEPESDRDFDPESETEGTVDADYENSSETSDDACAEQRANNYFATEQSRSKVLETPSPRTASLANSKTPLPPVVLATNTIRFGHEPIKQYATYHPRKTMVPTIHAAPKRLFLCSKATPVVSSFIEHARDTIIEPETQKALGSLLETLAKTTKGKPKRRPVSNNVSRKALTDLELNGNTKTNARKRHSGSKSVSTSYETARKTVAKSDSPPTLKVKRKSERKFSAAQPTKSARTTKFAKGSRPKDNSDLRPEFSPDLKMAFSIKHDKQIPDQELRLRVPYPAPSPLLDKSFDKYWNELEKAEFKIRENPEMKRPNIPWTVWEDDCVIEHMLDIRLDPTIPETEARFKEAARRLMEVHNVYRTETAIKNMWNRVGRARSGFDERKRQGEEMATSLQAGKKRKKVKFDEDSDSDLEEGEIRSRKKR